MTTLYDKIGCAHLGRRAMSSGRRIDVLGSLRLAVFFFLIGCSTSRASSLETSFDFSHSEIGIEVSIRGKTLYAIVDTGVDPSVINLAEADELGLKVDRSDSGEAGGFGEGRGMTVFPARIEGLSIRGRNFAAFDALASDTAAFTGADQRRIDVVLGYSFLSDKIVLIDYIAQQLAILDSSSEARATVRTCRTRWRIPLKTFESYPVIPGFRLGEARGPVTLDTGSSGGIALFEGALDLPGIRHSLVRQGASIRRGARGESKVENFILSQPVGFGPFTLPAGQLVFVHKQQGSMVERIANVGNTVLAAFKIKMLLDYRSRIMSFYGDCL
jgi:hypothetical protein